ncbi:MAG: hypothetical protein M5U26_14340 [Planctomycetota bacterium]|nr:hypothetical protein [Planctomycetota bacterium]
MPRIGVRVIAYLIVIAAIWIVGRNRSGNPSAPLPTTQEDGKRPAQAKTREPQGDDDSDPGVPAELDRYYPRHTFYFWSSETLPGGARRIQVLLRFTGNVDELQWEELKLRRMGESADLAAARGPEGRARPGVGVSRLVFELPAGAAPFEEGRVYCWNRDLCKLTPERRVKPAQLEQAHQEAEREDAAKTAGPKPPTESGP